MENKSFAEHSKEIGKYLLIDFGIFTALFFICFTLTTKLLPLLLSYYTITSFSLSPLEYLTAQMKVAVLLALIMSLPIIVYSIYRYCKDFVQIKKAILIITISYLLGVIGFFLGSTIFTKAVLQSMQDITPIQTLWGINSILSITASTGFIMAVTLELFILIPLLMKIGLINYEFYKAKRIMLLFGLLVAVAIITPDPTMFTTTILFCPIAVSLEGGFH
jgi:sec-independent protein translocase protein TatC